MSATSSKLSSDIEVLQEQRKLLEVKLAQQQVAMLESFFTDDLSFGGSDLFDRLRQRDPDGTTWLPLSQPSDRRHGSNWPMWRTLIELGGYRQRSRVLCRSNSYAKGLLRNLTNYIIGKGYTYKVAAKPEDSQDEAAGLVKEVQKVLDEFCRRNNWNGMGGPNGQMVSNSTREREAFRRVKRDGEAFVRFFKEEDGRVTIRFVEPERIIDPPGTTYVDGWSFGIQHQMEPYEDVETRLAYHAVYADPSTVGTTSADTTGETIPADEILHIKDADEDGNVARCMPEFVMDVYDALARASRLQRNLSIGASIRAATAEIWQHNFGTQAQISSLMAGNQVGTRTGLNGTTTPQEQVYPGMIRRIPQGQELKERADDQTPNYIQGAQADLRQASAAFCAPEYMTGDASNSNYNSSKEAGSPFVQSATTDQEHFKAAFLSVMWMVIKAAVDARKLPSRVYDLVIQVEAAEVIKKDELQKAQADQINVNIGAKSPQTVSMELGLDPDNELANIEEHTERMGAVTQALGLPPDGAATGTGGPPAKKPEPKPVGESVREDWDPQKHPRGQPENPGEFGPGVSGDDDELNMSDNDKKELFTQGGCGILAQELLDVLPDSKPVLWKDRDGVPYHAAVIYNGRLLHYGDEEDGYKVVTRAELDDAVEYDFDPRIDKEKAIVLAKATAKKIASEL